MLGAGRGVIFAGPQAIGSERYNSTADILALLSEFKTFGMAVLEAMAAGLSMIVSEQMGVAALVRPSGSGVALRDVASRSETWNTMLVVRDDFHDPDTTVPRVPPYFAATRLGSSDLACAGLRREPRTAGTALLRVSSGPFVIVPRGHLPLHPVGHSNSRRRVGY